MTLVLSFLAGLVLASIGAYVLLRNYKASARELSAAKDQAHQVALSTMDQTHQAAMAAMEKNFSEQLERVTAQMKSTTNELIQQQREELGKANTENVGKLLTPLQQEMENVRKLMGDTRSANEKSTASLEGALQAMLKQTSQISQDANNLADALKNRGKVHGDWGEQVLEDILSGSGLREGIEFTTQESFKGDYGNELRPDVVIHCADGKCIIVDSKVSLTAYADALGADTEEERQAAIRRNCESVKKHVRELTDKQYPRYVEGSMNYVLMFVPNEGAYVMAMNYDPSLAQEAFRQGVVIVNPTNLMLTLHLVLQTWQQTRQEDNCKKILDAANGMYEKVIGLVDTCATLGTQLQTVQNTYNKAWGQLSDGTGNVLRRVEALKSLGVTSTKKTRTTMKKLLVQTAVILVALLFTACGKKSDGTPYISFENYDCKLEISYELGTVSTPRAEQLRQEIRQVADSLAFTERDMHEAHLAKDYFDGTLIPLAKKRFQPLLDSLEAETVCDEMSITLKMTHSVYTTVGYQELRPSITYSTITRVTGYNTNFDVLQYPFEKGYNTLYEKAWRVHWALPEKDVEYTYKPTKGKTAEQAADEGYQAYIATFRGGYSLQSKLDSLNNDTVYIEIYFRDKESGQITNRDTLRCSKN